jgi:hypothetical protein
VAQCTPILVILINITRMDQTVSGNRKELEELKSKLNVIITIVEKYKEHDGAPVLKDRIKQFSECVTRSSFSVNLTLDNAI